MRRSTWRRHLAVAGTLALLLSACASTNTEREPGAIDTIVDATPDDDETEGGPTSPAPASPSASGAPSGAEPIGPASPRTTAAEEPSDGGGTSGTTGGAAADGGDTTGSTDGDAGDTSDGGVSTVPMGPGVTDDTITIGFQNSEDLEAGFAVVGAEGDPADERKIAEALVTWVNDTGGIRGRELKAVHHGTDSSNGTWASQAQAACSTFTEDNQVFAVVSSAVGGDDSLLACLAEKRTPDIELNLWLFDKPYFEEHRGILYRPGKMRADVWAREYIEGLAEIGYWDDATVGLLRFDEPVFDRLSEQVVNPTIERLGLELTDEVEVSTPQSVSDFGGMAGEFNNAIVRFRSQGIDHVIMLENAGIMPFFFHQEAESQGYRPDYGLTSTDIPDTLEDQSPVEQLRGSVGIGWTPPNDVGHDGHPGDNANYTRCRQIMEKYGVTNLTGFYIQSRCDAVFFLRATLERAPDLTRAGFLTSVESLGSEYLSPFTLGSSFGPGKYDGADVLRPFAFMDDGESYEYTYSSYLRD